MEDVMLAIQQLIRVAVDVPGSPLEGVKRVYFGDPMTVASDSLPAIIVAPGITNIVPRGCRYDQKTHNIQAILLYSQAQYYDNFRKETIATTSVSRLAGVVTVVSTAPHGLKAGQDFAIDKVDPSGYNGTFKVASIIDPTTFTYSRSTDPGAYVSGGEFFGADIETVYAVKAAIQRAEKVDMNGHTLENTIVSTVQQNHRLPYTDESSVTYNTCELAKAVSVDYTFSIARGYPTFEIIVNIQAIVIGDR